MCERCNLAKIPHLKVRTPMHSIVAREPLEVIAIDVTVLEPASNDMENVLVITDVYSKFTIAVPTRNQTVTANGSQNSGTGVVLPLWSSVLDTLGPGMLF